LTSRYHVNPQPTGETMRKPIPFVPMQQEGKHWVKQCPVCGLKVTLKKRKDAESFTSEEFAAHYYAHEQKP